METISGDQKSNCHGFWPPNNIENQRKSFKVIENHQALDDQAKLIYYI